MAEDLTDVFGRLSLAASKLDADIDDILDQAKPRKRNRKTHEEIKTKLEQDFLTPSTSFRAEWLDRLQQGWEAPTN